jgi:hypothetical protein
VASLTVGLDLGQARDYTALAVVEHLRLDLSLPSHSAAAWRLDLRHLERVELGTPYPAIVERVWELMQTPQLVDDAYLVVDQTGVGRPIMDMLDDAWRRTADPRRRPARPLGVTITADEKLNLVTGLEAALQTDRLWIRDPGPLAERLAAELRAFRVKISATGHPTFEAERESDHDDLVVALALACAYRGRGDARVVNPDGTLSTTSMDAWRGGWR